MVETTVLSQRRDADPAELVASGPVRSETSSRPALRLLVLVPKATGVSPGQRFRLEQWAPRVAHRHRITMDFVPFESPQLTELLHKPGRVREKALWVGYDFARRAGTLLHARDYDGVVVFRETALIGPAIYERLLAWSKTPLFFDFDDAIWLAPEASSINGVFSRLRFPAKTSATCRVARAVLVGNEYLAAYARARNDNVFVVPTSIELEKYPLQPELEFDDPFVVCWTGSTSTLAHFEHARVALERLAAKRKIVVKVICNKPPERPIAGAENVFVQWTETGEAEAVGSSHVGIMPLPDDAWSRGKCGLKALQYMATGRPVVVAPVGMNVDLVQSGDNGLLARSDDEWVAALESLANSRALRTRIGAAGRKTIEQRFSAEVVADLFANAIHTALAMSATL